MTREINFKGFELTQMEQDEIIDKAARLYATLSERFSGITMQHCVDQVIRAYASYNPDEESVGKYA